MVRRDPEHAAVVLPPHVALRLPGVGAPAPEVEAVHVLERRADPQVPDVVQGLLVRDGGAAEGPDGVQERAGGGGRGDVLARADLRHLALAEEHAPARGGGLRPGGAQAGEVRLRPDRPHRPVLDPVEDGARRRPVLLVPADVLGGDRDGVRGGADGVQHPHEGPRGDQRAQQRGAPGPGVDQVLEQVRAPGLDNPRPLRARDGQPVLGVVQDGLPLRALHGDERVLLLGGAQGQGTRDRDPGRGAHPDHRGVVGLDGVGAVELGAQLGDVLAGAGAGEVQGGHHRVGQRVGDHAVHHVHPADAAPPGPRGPGEVVGVPGPQPRGAHRAQPPDLPAGEQSLDDLQGVGAQALEAHLDEPVRRPGGLEEAVELVEAGHGGLLEQDVGPHPEGGQGEVEVGVDGGGDHHDVHVRAGVLQLRQVAEHGHVRSEHPVVVDPPVDGRHQADTALLLEPADVREVASAEAADPHQADAHGSLRRGAGGGGGHGLGLHRFSWIRRAGSAGGFGCRRQVEPRAPDGAVRRPRSVRGVS